MAIFTKFNKTKFGVGDRVSVHQKIKEGEKTRVQVFEGIVIAIKNKGVNKTITVRRIGEQKVGIERIFPLSSPTIIDIKVIRKGTAGIRRSKLYFIRDKSKREIDKIYSRAVRRTAGKKSQKKTKKVIKKKTQKKTKKTKKIKKN